jgi:hypothetical protein
MRILRSIVAPSTAFMAFCDSKVKGCRPVRAQVICDQFVGDKAIFLQQLAHQFERRLPVPPALDQNKLKEIKDLLRNFCKQGA